MKDKCSEGEGKKVVSLELSDRDSLGRRLVSQKDRKNKEVTEGGEKQTYPVTRGTTNTQPRKVTGDF